MTDAMSKALDELMGKHRNAIEPEAKKQQLQFDDPDVCKHELAGLCPYTLFNNTKSDLGSCGFEVHLGHREFDRLQKEYDALTDEQKEELGYERVLYDVLASLIHRMDRNIAMNKKTVEKENQPRPIKPVDQSRLDSLKQQETESLERSEQLAMDGDADGSLAMAEAATRFSEEHERLRLELVTPERTKSVCEVCGVYINSTDSEERHQEHLRGKQYTGWTRIRAKFKELEAKYKRSAPGRYSAPDDYSRRPAERERELRDYDGGYSRGGDQGGGDRRQDRYSERDRYDSRGGYGRDRGSDRYSERDRYGDRGGRDRYGDRRGGGSRGYDDRSYRR